MRNINETKKIKCSIFQAKNKIIEEITRSINEAKDIEQKVMMAQKLLKEVEELLSCEYFSDKKVECKTCHYITKLRQQTANLILKAKNL